MARAIAGGDGSDVDVDTKVGTTQRIIIGGVSGSCRKWDCVVNGCDCLHQNILQNMLFYLFIRLLSVSCTK